MRGFTISDPTDEAAYIGPLTRAPQLDVLERQVADAVAKGASVLLGGQRLAGPATGSRRRCWSTSTTRWS